jgi:hypothetical protein
MQTLKYVIAAGLIAVIASGPQAQVAQDLKEKAQDHRNIRQDAVNVYVEQKDIDHLSDLVMHWNTLRAANAGPDQLAGVQNEIAVELRRDLKLSSVQTVESSRKTRQARQELRRDRRDLRSDVQDVQAAQAAGGPAVASQERQELRDDLKDKRDDRRDAIKETRDRNQAAQILQQKREIAGRLCALQQQIDAGGKGVKELQQRQEGLLNQYLALSQKEVSMGLRQYVEDRQELREDRRETREDLKDGDR